MTARSRLVVAIVLLLLQHVTSQSWTSQVDNFVVEQVATKACDLCDEKLFEPSDLTPLGTNKLVFVGFGINETGNPDIFIADERGNVQLLLPDEQRSQFSPFNLYSVQDHVVVVPLYQDELWTMDASQQAAVPLTNGISARDIIEFQVYFKEKLYFQTGNAPIYQYWSTDGTPANTAVFRESSEMFVLGDSLYFADNVGGVIQHFESDGTFSGTLPTEFPVGSNFEAWYAFEDSILFERGVAVYVTNGVDTFQVVGNARLYKRLIREVGGWKRFLAQANGRLVFSTGHPVVLQRTVWATDGTPNGTVALTDQSDLVEASSFVSFNDRVYFIGDTADGSAYASNNSLWSTDGTLGGTTRVDLGDIVPWILIGEYCGKLFFWGYSTPSYLYMTDGTAAGTSLVSSIRKPLREDDVIVNGELFLNAETLLPGNSSSRAFEAIFKVVNAECSTASTSGACALLGESCNSTVACCDSTHACSGVCVGKSFHSDNDNGKRRMLYVNHMSHAFDAILYRSIESDSRSGITTANCGICQSPVERLSR